MKNHGDGRDKPRPSAYETTAMEMYRHGQRNSEQRATEIITTDNENYTNPVIIRRRAGISILLFIHAFIYIRIWINNKIHI